MNKNFLALVIRHFLALASIAIILAIAWRGDQAYTAYVKQRHSDIQIAFDYIKKEIAKSSAKDAEACWGSPDIYPYKKMVCYRTYGNNDLPHPIQIIDPNGIWGEIAQKSDIRCLFLINRDMDVAEPCSAGKEALIRD